MKKMGGWLFAFSICLSATITCADGMETSAKYAYILDFDTGKTLYQKNAQQLMAPASMSKLMTTYLVFDKLKQGKVELTDEFIISQTAFDRRGSSMFAQLKSKISVENLLKGIIVVSGNDAAIAVAEGILGSEAIFADEMQKISRDIGLTKSTFVNATGWPDENQQMTMHDLGHLAYRLIKDFPEHYHYFSMERFKWGKVDQPNRNILLDDGIGVDGLKTGRTEESGYGMVASAFRDGRRVIVVLNGLDSAAKRAKETRRLIDWAFNAFDKFKIYAQGDIIGAAKVAGGDVREVELTVAQDVTAFLNVNGLDNLTANIVYNNPVPAPISKGQEIAKLHIVGEDGFTLIVPLVAQKTVANGSRVDQSIDILRSWVDKKLDSIF